MFSEILSTEQPCILCGMALLIVTIHRDSDTGAEETRRTLLPHDEDACRAMLALYPEIWPQG